MFVSSFLSSVRSFVFETLNGRLPLEQSSDRRETLAKRVSDDPQFFHFSTLNLFLQNVFRQKFRDRFFFKKVRFLRSYEFAIRVGRCVVKSYCPKCLYFRGDFLGEGVNGSICVENLDLGLKMTSAIWCCENMIL